ncbi:hypothetical protein AAIR98_001233 [Elusimicrobium simillimum]|uniref:hypothetical protein n=1 Tax=Elusimicrobium simillimum TaxID=3143438 RepID=UPI003C6EE4CE
MKKVLILMLSTLCLGACATTGGYTARSYDSVYIFDQPSYHTETVIVKEKVKQPVIIASSKSNHGKYHTNINGNKNVNHGKNNNKKEPQKASFYGNNNNKKQNNGHIGGNNNKGDKAAAGQANNKGSGRGNKNNASAPSKGNGGPDGNAGKVTGASIRSINSGR